MKLPAALALAPVLLTQLLSAQLVYVGTYTAPQSSSKGIYAYRFDARNGKMAPLGLMAETPNPTFLAVHPNGKYLYAINEINEYNGKQAGSVSAYSIDKATGKLTLLNTVSSASPGPCHVAVDATGKAVLVANYAGGSFASFPVMPDGKLGEAASFIQEQGSSVNKQRQSAPHGHSVVVTKNNKFVLSGDLGTDKVRIFKLDPATARITPNTPDSAPVKPGSGPRHLAISPDQKHVYVISEMASTITTFDFNANTGAMKEIGTVSTLPDDFKGKSTTAEIMIDAKGQYLYGSNRGHDSIAVFSIDPKTALPTRIETVSTGGKTPRAFVIDPSGNYILVGNQDTHNILVLKIDHASGKLSPVNEKIELGAPVTFAFVQ
jgi:6-phosphogluconolactonase